MTQYVNKPIYRFEHCNFTTTEMLIRFSVLLRKTASLASLNGVGTVLEGAELQRFEALAKKFKLPRRVEGPALKARTGID